MSPEDPMAKATSMHPEFDEWWERFGAALVTDARISWLGAYAAWSVAWDRRQDQVAALMAQIASLQQEKEEALKVLAVSMPQNGLVDACRQIKQVAVSEADNSSQLEASLAALRTQLEQLVETWWRTASSDSIGWTWYQGCARALGAILRAEEPDK